MRTWLSSHVSFGTLADGGSSAVNQANPEGTTPLIMACLGNNTTMAKATEILDAGANAGATATSGSRGTALHYLLPNIGNVELRHQVMGYVFKVLNRRYCSY